MRNNRIYAISVAVVILSVLWSCQKQGDEPTPQPEGETVDVKFNTFLKEGDNIRPLNLGTRSATEGTLDYGFYLYGHAHTKSFANTSGNTYTTIFEAANINADGTYGGAKFWLKDKNLLYSFQAYANNGNFPTDREASGTPPYVFSSIGNNTYYLGKEDILGAGTFDIKMGDEAPTVNLYFEHIYARLVFKAQRMNAGGPTLYNVRIIFNNSSTIHINAGNNMYWVPGKGAHGNTSSTINTPIGGTDPVVTLPASDMTPVQINHWVFPPQSLEENWTDVRFQYTLEPGAVSDANKLFTLTTSLPALTLESGKQLNVVIGHVVETEQIVVQSVTLTDWVTIDKNVPEYK